MVDEPKPKNTGRRRVADLTKNLTVKEKKAKKSAQEKLADKKKELVKAQNYWATKNSLKEIDKVFTGEKNLIEEDKIEDTTPSIRNAIKEKVIFEPNEGPQTEFLAASEEVFMVVQEVVVNLMPCLVTHLDIVINKNTEHY